MNRPSAPPALFCKRGIHSGVIGFMFSFLNDAHVTIPTELARVMREYERFSTAAMNCHVGPWTACYLRGLDARPHEAGVTSKLRIMPSNGGVSTVDSCARRPIRILMSGPAGGVIGGTPADISTIPGGPLKIMNQRDTYVSGHPVLTPMIDLVTTGAGVGFVAFNVGPRSAGPEPGPACHGRGGAGHHRRRRLAEDRPAI